MYRMSRGDGCGSGLHRVRAEVLRPGRGDGGRAVGIAASALAGLCWGGGVPCRLFGDCVVLFYLGVDFYFYFFASFSSLVDFSCVRYVRCVTLWMLFWCWYVLCHVVFGSCFIDLFRTVLVLASVVIFSQY